ncbi:MAG: hypothetical protein Q9219_005471 [cf. Caloplaca sp. 3 TL-2023]
MSARHGIIRTLRPSRSYIVGTPIQRRLLQSTSKTYHKGVQTSLKDVHIRNYKASASPEEPSSLTEDVRIMMRRIPHPVILITAQNADSPNPSGLLVSSFNTITLSPTPYVSFNLKLPSTTYSEIQGSKTFTASAISNPELAKDFLLDKKNPLYTAALQRNVEKGKSKLAGGKGGIWWMRCHHMERESVRVADHVVVIGSVVETGFYGVILGSADNESRPPLIYSEGRYRIPGDVVG